MKNILIATDFSEASQNAITHGRHIAKAFSCEISYFHAFTPPLADPNTPAGLIETSIQAIIETNKSRMIKEIEIDANLGLKSTINLSYSDIVSGIEELIIQNHIDLVIIGKTGSRSFIDKIIGSTANHLIHHINIPLLVVPQSFRSDIFNRVGYASQLEYDELKFLKKAKLFAAKTKQKMAIIHIESSSEMDINANETFITEIKKDMKEDEIDLILHGENNLNKGLKKEIKSLAISLLAVTTHKRNIFTQLLNPSKVKQLTEETEIPILIYNFEKE
jgi:nucleotide-binding universal stress UspA family protein